MHRVEDRPALTKGAILARDMPNLWLGLARMIVDYEDNAEDAGRFAERLMERFFRVGGKNGQPD